ncbi:MAG: HAD-IIB family hydrolase [Gammaproteobacteria bacterium]|nr:HAD-IIB family hydrolase [Gammaproteobacteria bacterium]
MATQLLICTDLDRTLIPNGEPPEDPRARALFAAFAARPEVLLVYVSGRDRGLVEQAIEQYSLPIPDHVISDVGTRIHDIDPGGRWTIDLTWQQQIQRDWKTCSRADIAGMLAGLPELVLQPAARQNDHKLSYFVPAQGDNDALSAKVMRMLAPAEIEVRLIFSVDDITGEGLLDILPANASKYHAIIALMEITRNNRDTTVFCGDSGNDMEVLVSPLDAVLVGNASAQVKARARDAAAAAGLSEHLYVAQGGFLGMNANYSAGMLEGIAHYHPAIVGMLPDIASGD